jgi:hypothetical protein
MTTYIGARALICKSIVSGNTEILVCSHFLRVTINKSILSPAFCEFSFDDFFFYLSNHILTLLFCCIGFPFFKSFLKDVLNLDPKIGTTCHVD